MKRFLLALIIGTTSLLSFNSCTKEYITNNNYLPGFSYVYEAVRSDWTRDGNVFELRINMSDLDDRYFQDGHVGVSISLDTEPDVYEIIPATFKGYSYSANYGVGVVKVYAEFLGNGTPVAPEPMHVKIVLTDAEVGN